MGDQGLDRQPIGDGLDDQIISGDGSVGDGLDTATLVQSSDMETAGLVENQEICERLDDDTSNNNVMSDEMQVPADNEPLQKIDDLDTQAPQESNNTPVDLSMIDEVPVDNKETSEIVKGQTLSLVSTDSLYDEPVESPLRQLSESDSEDQNLLANGINFKVVPEEEQREIDAEKEEVQH